MHNLWSRKFEPYGLKAALVTGDADAHMRTLDDIRSYQLAVATPEKWDAMTRDWNRWPQIAERIRLVCVDEVHLIGDERRGPTLEQIVTRTAYFRGDIRYIAATACLLNVEDVAHWFRLLNGQRRVKFFR